MKFETQEELALFDEKINTQTNIHKNDTKHDQNLFPITSEFIVTLLQSQCQWYVLLF